MQFTALDQSAVTMLASIAAREAAAYALLEEARLRCEYVGEREGEPEPREELRAVHKELGLAGFFAGANLAGSTRREALALAHARCQGAAPDDDRALEPLLVRARSAVEQSLIVSALSDHMHLAHVHAVSAQELLVRITGRGHAPRGEPGTRPARPASS